MTSSRMHMPGILIQDAGFLSSALSRSFMAAAVSWRSCTSSMRLVLVLPHRATPRTSAPLCRLGLSHFSACVKAQGGGVCRALSCPAPASFRLMAGVTCRGGRDSLQDGFGSRRAVDRDGYAVEQEGELEGVASIAPRNGECLESTAREGNDFVRDNVGGIHVIVGPMFAGKTTALLKRIRKEADAGRRVSLVKSDKDDRYAVSAVVSHDGVQMPCVAVPSLAAFRERVGEEEYRQMDVIGIDEAQFFDDLLDFCQSAADLDNKTVIVAGLDGDFLRRRFGAALDLIPLADSVTKLHARCELCNQPAPFTFRKTVDTETEVIGGADVYMPVCRHHFVTGQSVVETARSVLQVHQESGLSVPSEVEDMQECQVSKSSATTTPGLIIVARKCWERRKTSQDRWLRIVLQSRTTRAYAQASQLVEAAHKDIQSPSYSS